MEKLSEFRFGGFAHLALTLKPLEMWLDVVKMQYMISNLSVSLSIHKNLSENKYYYIITIIKPISKTAHFKPFLRIVGV